MKFDTGEFYCGIVVEPLQFPFRSHNFKQSTLNFFVLLYPYST